MELRREHRKLSLAIVVALDRSGSMAVPVPGGTAENGIGRRGHVRSAESTFGRTINSAAWPSTRSPTRSSRCPILSTKADMEAKILKIDSHGRRHFHLRSAGKGGRDDLRRHGRHAAHHSVCRCRRQRRAGRLPSTCWTSCVKAGITVSVIGLGTERDSDAELLKDIARRGGGQCMFTNDAHELPRLFAQDTFLVSRSTFVDEPTSRSNHGWHGHAHATVVGRVAAGRRLQPVLSAARSESGGGHARRVPGSAGGRLAGGRRPRACVTPARPTANTPARSPPGRKRASSSARWRAGSAPRTKAWGPTCCSPRTCAAAPAASNSIWTASAPRPRSARCRS